MNADKHKILDKIIFYQASIEQWQHHIDEFKRMRIALPRETYEWAEKNDPGMLSELIPQEFKDAVASYRQRISESREKVAQLAHDFTEAGGSPSELWNSCRW